MISAIFMYNLYVFHDLWAKDRNSRFLLEEVGENKCPRLSMAKNIYVGSYEELAIVRDM